jgi:hypothetical protein
VTLTISGLPYYEAQPVLCSLQELKSYVSATLDEDGTCQLVIPDIKKVSLKASDYHWVVLSLNGGVTWASTGRTKVV